MLWKGTISLTSVFLVFALQTSHSKSINPVSELHRILNGTSTTVEKYPSMVKLETRYWALNNNGVKKINDSYCGGTVLTPNCVLTAAHCVDQSEMIDIHATAGITKFSEFGQYSKATSWIPHSGYDYKSIDLDVAVVVLETPLKGELIETVEFDLNWAPGDDVITVTGWGQTTEENIDNDPLRSLQEVDVPVTSCPAQYSIGHGWYEPTENMFCAGGKDGKSSCNGDSGGPAFHDGQQVGIVSFGPRCDVTVANDERIGYYVLLRSPAIQEFIRAVKKEYCESPV